MRARTGMLIAKTDPQSVVSLLYCNITLYIVIILTQQYYFPNNLCLVLAEMQHNNTRNKKFVWQLLGIPKP